MYQIDGGVSGRRALGAAVARPLPQRAGESTTDRTPVWSRPSLYDEHAAVLVGVKRAFERSNFSRFKSEKSKSAALKLGRPEQIHWPTLRNRGTPKLPNVF